MTEVEYDVCLSFAGEQRSYVHEVARLLKSRTIRVFYDGYEQANLWGKDLYEHLDMIYRKKARFCVVFISRDYANKVWTTHERRSVQARALSQNQEYVLPVRFDDTEIPGILPTTGFIDLRTTSPEDLVDLIAGKLGDNKSGRFNKPLYTAVPKTAPDRTALISLKPDAWEYMLLAGIFAEEKERLAPKLADVHVGYPKATRNITGRTDGLRVVREYLDDLDAICNSLAGLFDQKLQLWAFGAPGEPGDPFNIIHLGNRFMNLFERLIDWNLKVRGTTVDQELRGLLTLIHQMAELPLKQVSHFVDTYISEVSQSPERLASGQPIKISIGLTISTDEKIVKKIKRESRRLRG